MPKAIEVEYTPGDVLAGKYRIEKRLGGGAMGTVYEATRIDLRKRCAIKVLRSTLVNRKDLRKEFEREAQIHSDLEGNPHICTVFDIGAENGTPFYAMNLLHGRPLSDFLHYHYVGTDKRAPKPVPLHLWLSIAHQLAEALVFAHERGIIHRDIKPQNLFVHAMGHAWWLVIVDFGIAKREGGPSETRDGFFGTPPYAPPEQILGRQPSAKMDVYAAAVVIFKMLTGRTPFAHLGDEDITKFFSATPPIAPLLTEFGDFSPDLARLLARCLSHDPEERPDSSYVAQELRRFAQEAEKSAPININATYEDPPRALTTMDEEDLESDGESKEETSDTTREAPPGMTAPRRGGEATELGEGDAEHRTRSWKPPQPPDPANGQPPTRGAQKQTYRTSSPIDGPVDPLAPTFLGAPSSPSGSPSEPPLNPEVERKAHELPRLESTSRIPRCCSVRPEPK